MKENEKKAFDFAADVTKQLITLSSAIITLSITFSKDIIQNVSEYARHVLVANWFVYILSTIFGILTLQALTGSLLPQAAGKKPAEKPENQPETAVEDKDTPLSIYQPNIRFLSMFQLLAFIVALSMTAYFGCIAVKKPQPKSREGMYPLVRRSMLGADTTVYVDTVWVPKR